MTNGFKIESISWWEWCAGKKKNEYGIGGPESVFYDGWFSEIPVVVDELDFSACITPEDFIQKVIATIETKTISFSDKTVTFDGNSWLTPAIWLDVPDDWRNTYSV